MKSRSWKAESVYLYLFTGFCITLGRVIYSTHIFSLSSSFRMLECPWREIQIFNFLFLHENLFLYSTITTSTYHVDSWDIYFLSSQLNVDLGNSLAVEILQWICIICFLFERDVSNSHADAVLFFSPYFLFCTRTLLIFHRTLPRFHHHFQQVAHAIVWWTEANT